MVTDRAVRCGVSHANLTRETKLKEASFVPEDEVAAAAAACPLRAAAPETPECHVITLQATNTIGTTTTTRGSLPFAFTRQTTAALVARDWVSENFVVVESFLY